MTATRVTLKVHGTEGRHGWGVARDGDLTVFLPGCLPEDTVECRLEPSGKRRWTMGQDIEILSPSDKRIPPACPHHPDYRDNNGRGCGGCPLMALSPEEALGEKTRYATRALSQQKIDIAPEVIASSGPAFNYRWRLRPRWEEGRLGFNEAASSRIHPVDRCAVALFPSIPGALKRILPLKGAGELRVTMTPRGEVALHVDRTLPKNALAPLPVALGDGLSLVSLQTGDRLQGAPFIDLGAKGDPRWVSPLNFAQAGPFANSLILDSLDDLLREAAPRGPILECYAGSGNLTAVARRFGPVTACEEVPSVREAFRRNLGEGVKLITRPVERLRIDFTPSVLVLDPPRSGISGPAMYTLRGAKAAAIVLFSCDPMAGARDIARFRDAGYRVARIRLLDTMPNTPHFELATLLFQ